MLANYYQLFYMFNHQRLETVKYFSHDYFLLVLIIVVVQPKPEPDNFLCFIPIHQWNLHICVFLILMSSSSVHPPCSSHVDSWCKGYFEWKSRYRTSVSEEGALPLPLLWCTKQCKLWSLMLSNLLHVKVMPSPCSFL